MQLLVAFYGFALFLYQNITLLYTKYCSKIQGPLRDAEHRQPKLRIETQNRVLIDDVIKTKFLKLWDLSGYSERTMSKRPICQK